jgi:predicted RNA binding protein YcfA (HicA-like mRNA interferase family)
MSKKLPALKPKIVLRALERNGFYIHHVKGSHYFLRKGEINLVIPLHNKDMKPGMLHGIIRQCGLTVEEFLDLL